MEKKENNIINIFVGASVKEFSSMYTLVAKLPNGCISFRGPQLVEGTGRTLSKLKLIALKNFLDSSESFLCEGTAGMCISYWSHDDELAESWKLIETYGIDACNVKYKSLWFEIYENLISYGLTMEVKGGEKAA